MDPNNALISRRMFPIDQGRVVIEEKWDLTSPDCPFIRNPWNPYQGPMQSPHVRQVVMTQAEYDLAKPPLKP